MIPPFYFLAIRFLLAAGVLALVYRRHLQRLPLATWGSGILIGIALWAAYSLQTFGLLYTTPAKAGFITGLSVVMVPVIAALWLHMHPTIPAILGTLVATAGLALLSLGGDLQISLGDLLVLGCAVGFALHIVAVARFTKSQDPIALTVIQVLTTGVLSALSSFLLEDRVAAVHIPLPVWGSLVLTGLLATAVAFLLQNALQPYTSPVHTALIFATEPVFSALFAWVLVGEVLSGRQYLGAGLILLGMLLGEIPWPARQSDAAGQSDTRPA